ncbi:MAG: RloB family protein [Candidatus Pacebacteria bacterium]|nr:RloB family protein [Candidatus Paceibacterota bacterium]
MSSRFTRKQDNRKPRKVIFIYSEGTKTEPNYFNAIKTELRLQEVDIKVHGCADHTLPLVRWVIDRKTEAGNSDEGTEWWVVFDKDAHDGFDDAIKLARENGIDTAYSNECFELWFILHFDFLNTAIGRENYYSKLTKLLGTKYEKCTSNIYELIKDNEATAIRNAKKLEEQHDTSGTKSSQKRDPSTTVYMLVEKLRELKISRDIDN